MRSIAVAAVSNIVTCSVSLYKAHRSLYTRFDDRFIVQASREDSRPILRAYTTFVVFGVLLVRSDNLQGCAHIAPTGTRYILQVDCWGFLFLAHGGIEQARWICLLLAKLLRMRFVGWCTIVGGHVISAWSYILSSGRVNVNAIHTSHEPYSIARLIMSNIFDIPYRERILTWCQNKKTDGAFLSIRTPSICQA